MPIIKKTAAIMISNAKSTEVDRNHNCMASIVFSAFCFEAYINHICDEQFDKLRKHIKNGNAYSNYTEFNHDTQHTPKSKLGFLSRSMDIDIPQYDFWNELSILKNAIAYNKAVVISKISKDENIKEATKNLDIKLNECCELETAEKYYNEVVSWIEQVNQALILAKKGKKPEVIKKKRKVRSSLDYKHKAEIIFWTLYLRRKYNFNYYDLQQMLAERGFKADYTTISRWVTKYSSELDKRSEWSSDLLSDYSDWGIDETNVKIQGKLGYLYRALDKEGKIIDFYFSLKKDMKTAKRFLDKALVPLKSGKKPEVINRKPLT